MKKIHHYVSLLKMIYPWQQNQWHNLLQRKKHGNLAHAFLLCGSSGLGKLDFAKNFAKLLLCDDKNAEKPCEICRNCYLFSALTHPDFILITPEEKGKQIKIDQIRNLSEDLSKTSKMGGYKICIINQACTMNLAAANALLKTLEEPDGLTLIMLISSRPQSLPATILSRCQKIYFTLPNIALAQAWTTEKIENRDKIKGKNIENLLFMAEGSPLKALALSEQDLVARKEFLADLLRIIKGERDPISSACDHQDMDIKTLFSHLIYWTINIIKIKFNIKNSMAINNDESSILQQIANKASSKNVFLYIDKITHLNNMLLKGINLNKQLLLEDLLIDWTKI